MAVTMDDPPRRGESSGSQSRDVVLQKLAKTNTFDTEWPTLRSHLHQALDAAAEVFAQLGQPESSLQPPSPSVPGLSPTNPDDHPPPESLLLSPSAPTSALDPMTPTNPTSADPRSVDVEPSRSPDIPIEDRGDLDASTPGGLVIPPFPPLDVSRRRRTSSTSTLPPRVNGHARQPVNPMDEEWDEDVVIGGKKLPGWLEAEEAKKEVERVGKLLDGLDYAPFTVQRLAELLLDPTAMHTSLGKFLRALEKALLVNTPWEAPSYTYIPPASASNGFAYKSSSSDAGSDEDSMMPPGARTPMFSPIPFLRHDEVEDNIPMDIDGGGRTLEDGLMSPLNLQSGDSGRFGDALGIRSPTPEPDEVQGGPQSPKASLSSTSTDAPTGTSDPGHQSYLGRVDELDTGPLSDPQGQEEEVTTTGTGEGGNMTPHGMSEKPVPISSTTVINEERKIAGMPKTAEA